MKILSFDTTALSLSVALLDGQKVISQRIIRESGKQSELLIPEIEEILTDNKIWYQDLDLIAATKGPGSFTGSRIGLAVARTLKISTNIPLILLNSCEVIAHKYRKYSGRVFTILDAKGDEFFYAEFLNQISIKPPQLARTDDLLNILPQENFFLCGSGKIIAGEILKTANRKFESNDEEDEASADLVAMLAYEKFKSGESCSDNLDPIYLRSPRISKRKK